MSWTLVSDEIAFVRSDGDGRNTNATARTQYSPWHENAKYERSTRVVASKDTEGSGGRAPA